MRFHPRRLAATIAAIGLAGCMPAVDAPAGAGGTVVRKMAATIDSIAWVASSVEVAFDATVIRLTSPIGTAGARIVVQFHRSGLGEQELDGKTGGWYGELRAAGQPSLWMTGYLGAKGTVTLTTLTSDRVTGTFQFDAGALLPTSGSPDIRTARNGSFDVTF